ncbi:MAG: 3-oxoacyl-[acyl-carrier-protein] synthase III C-terminal domain-containing protein [Bacteroidia bacterium]|nr:3-oxoacyl-[acyl-carrier-protein] synthase III C-terminal domain-containing protein [Bacteroidia bacterium]
MTHPKPISILGMGKCLPKQKILSAELERKLGIPEGWSARYSGVEERYYADGESGAEMGARALEEALQHAEITVDKLDLILCGSATFDYPIPNQACVIKNEITGGQSCDVPAISVDSTCLSFVAAFDLAASLLDGKRYKRIGIVSVEIASKGLNSKDWETSTLFGDGAAAAVIGWAPEQKSSIIKADMKTWSENIFSTQVKGGGNACFFRDYPYDPELHSFSMEGKTLLKMAHTKIPLFMESFFSDLDMGITDVELIIPHQASRIGVELFFRMYPFRREQFFGNLSTHGNCISASIPMALYDAIETGKLQRGQTCMICGTSAGFSIGALLFRY